MSAANPYVEVISDIARGARLHYENETSADPDLDLLLGDRSYASGLAKLARIGDVEETARLADLIARLAQLHADGQSAAARQVLIDAEQRLGAAGVGEQRS
ncbi:MAG TPA: hypothetical protein VMV16_09210 [Solirubrobacteraceae bacterium]|nr:hypothetical protein [Solirubrobacteraceae bacterium]